MKSSKNDFIFLPAFYLVMCLMKAPKNFWKIVFFKTRELVSFWGVKTHFGKLPIIAFSGITKFDYYVVTLNKLRFRHTNHLKMTIWTSFLYKIPCSWQTNDTKWSKNGHLRVISFQKNFFQNWKKICKPKTVFHVVAFDLFRT